MGALLLIHDRDHGTLPLLEKRPQSRNPIRFQHVSMNRLHVEYEPDVIGGGSLDQLTQEAEFLRGAGARSIQDERMAQVVRKIGRFDLHEQRMLPFVAYE